MTQEWLAAHHCCQVSPKPSQLRNNSKKYIKNSAPDSLVIFWDLTDLGRKYFILKPKSQHQKFTFYPNCPGKAQKIYKCFPVPCLPVFAKIMGPTATNIPRPKNIFGRPLLCYFAEFSATWQQGLLTAVGMPRNKSALRFSARNIEVAAAEHFLIFCCFTSCSFS